MLEIKQNISLKPFTTMALDVTANKFLEINSIKDLKEFFSNYKNEDFYVLGGGSNVLFLNDFKGFILKIDLKGISIESEDDDFVYLKASAGENWHQFVQYTLDKNYGGLENLSLIPGTVGASPIQNIGAYGVEVKDCIEKVEAFNTKTLKLEYFNNKDCKFDYRESIFKRDLKGKYIVTSVIFKLTKKNHKLNVNYGAIKEELNNLGAFENPTIQKVSEAVINIRESKLPNPKDCPNTGSFFKNPIIETEKYNTLHKKYINIPGYPITDKEIKVPAGWLIENTGWKGKRKGNVGVHDKQALVLINPGYGTGEEVYNLSQEIIDSVKNIFGIELEREVNVIKS
ncbi:UDP-N-acetylmuramate dehydrogenase [Weeksellaceae bacterium TAE3-ERU29]|nr:UDP-N-acetylmuramate dehydrogenase [Weeksellaceae bacterium TAE3-ERU29]